MAKRSPQQEAWYALQWDLSRDDLPRAVQLEYDRLQPVWEQELTRLAWARGHLSPPADDPPADEQRGSLLVTRPGRYARPLTGDQVRDTTFLIGGGYDVTQVDDLLRRIAEELDAGRPAEPLIRSAAFPWRRPGYDIGAVDWFLGQLLCCPGPAELAELSADPWRDLGVVARFSRSGFANFAPEPRSATKSRLARGEYYAVQYREAWLDFGKQPGMFLRMKWVGRASCELLTMEMQTIASMRVAQLGWDVPRGDLKTVSIGQKSFTLRKVNRSLPSPPGVHEIGARTSRDSAGHFAAKTAGSQDWRKLGLRELVDEAGTPVMYASVRRFGRRAGTSISFPDRRWLRFPVRGTRQGDAIMTAVDEAGNSVVRYRFIPDAFGRGSVEIAVHPGWALTDELVLAIAMSTPWLSSYFVTSGGGG